MMGAYYEVRINGRTYARFIDMADAELFVSARQALKANDSRYEIVTVSRAHF
jgi:hypothetical protein